MSTSVANSYTIDSCSLVRFVRRVHSPCPALILSRPPIGPSSPSVIFTPRMNTPVRPRPHLPLLTAPFPFLPFFDASFLPCLLPSYTPSIPLSSPIHFTSPTHIHTLCLFFSHSFSFPKRESQSICKIVHITA